MVINPSGGDPEDGGGRRTVSRLKLSGNGTSFLLGKGQADNESGPLAGGARCCDASSMTLDDPSADRKAHAGSLVLVPGMEPFERLEDLVQVSPVESYPIVPKTNFAKSG